MHCFLPALSGVLLGLMALGCGANGGGDGGDLGVGGDGGDPGVGGDGGDLGVGGDGGAAGAAGAGGEGGMAGRAGSGGDGGAGGVACIPDFGGTGGFGGSGDSEAAGFEWKPPQSLPFPASAFGHAAVGGNASGHVVVLWNERFGEEWDLLAAVFSPGSGWQGPESVNRHNQIALRVDVAVGPTGDAMAAWSQEGRKDNGARDRSIWASRYTPGEGWTTPELAESDDTGHAFQPELVVDAGGNAHLLWRRNDAPRSWRNRYTSSEGWGPGEPLADGWADRLIGDDAGNALVVFNAGERVDGILISSDLWVQRYEPTEGWGEPVKISDAKEELAYSADLAMASDGTAIAAWHQNERTMDGYIESSVWANRYTPKCGWGAPSRIEHFDNNSAGFEALPPKVAIGSNGHGFVAWAHSDGSVDEGSDARANFFFPGVGWGNAERIGPDSFFGEYWSATQPELVVDDLGNAVAVWQQGGDLGAGQTVTRAVLFNRYLRSTGWGTWDLVSEFADREPDSQCCPALLGLRDGKAAALWTESRDDVSGFWTSRFE